MGTYINRGNWRGMPPGWWFGRSFGGGWKVAYGGAVQALHSITKRLVSPDTRHWDHMLPSHGALYGGPYGSETAARKACQTFAADHILQDRQSRIEWLSEGGTA